MGQEVGKLTLGHAHIWCACLCGAQRHTDMHIIKEAGGQIKTFAILMAIVFPLGVAFAFASVASADYVIAQNAFPTPYAQHVGAVEWLAFDFVATSSVTQADRIDLPACMASSLTPSETLYLSVYTKSGSAGSYFYNHVASSTLSTLGNTVLCPASATSTVTFVFDTPLQWVSGVTMYFVLHNPLVGTSNFRLVSSDIGSPEWKLYFSSTSSTPDNTYFNQTGNLYTKAISATLRGLGTAPTNQNIYGASSTVVICRTFDAGCYISTSLAWAFVPNPEIINSFGTLTLASSTPFNYLYEMGGYFGTLRNGASTTIAEISIPFMGDSLVIFNSATFGATLQANQPALASVLVTVKLFLGYALWLLALFVVWREVHGILKPQT